MSFSDTLAKSVLSTSSDAIAWCQKDGTAVSLEFTIVPLRDGGGELTGLSAIMRDVTKRFEEMRALKKKFAEAMKVSS